MTFEQTKTGDHKWPPVVVQNNKGCLDATSAFELAFQFCEGGPVTFGSQGGLLGPGGGIHHREVRSGGVENFLKLGYRRGSQAGKGCDAGGMQQIADFGADSFNFFQVINASCFGDLRSFGGRHRFGRAGE